MVSLDDEFGFQLRRRMATAAASALADATASPGNASDHLKRARDAAFGLNRNPGLAYSEAIKAVEAAAIPVVLPNDPLATLGKIIGHLRATLQARTCVLARSIGASRGTPETPVEIITKLAELLWVNQTDRHAAGDLQPPQPILQPQAEWAVHIALLLVGTFRSGAIS